MNAPTPLRSGLIAAGLVVATCIPRAAIVIDLGPGPASPPPTLGGYSLTPFADDPGANFDLVDSAPAPGGGLLGFSFALSHREIGAGWDTWSHGYAGDVYFTGGASELTLTLPAGTLAFYLYVQPNTWGPFEFEVSSALTVSPLFQVDGDSGAQYVGIYTTDPGDPLATVRLRNTDGRADGFAVGEFATNVPEPSAAAVLAGVACFGWRLGRRQRA